VRDVEPGEVVVVDRRGGIRSFKPFPPEPTAHCVFEHVYFARPDSLVSRQTVLESRLALGRQLAREQPAGRRHRLSRCPTAGWARRSASRRRAGCRSSGA
jgi:amidophosphoribosyltransferase